MTPKKSIIYLDSHSTTPMDPRVIKVMTETLKKVHGNAASIDHEAGKQAEVLVETARRQVADLIGAQPEEIVFTSGATESNNLALKGISELYQDKGSHIITQTTEHKSVLEVCRYLEKKSARVDYLPVDSNGLVDLKKLEAALSKETILISIMMANHEIGTIQPIEAIGKIAKSKGIFFHVDASQAAGKIPIDVEKMGIDLLSFSAHKMYGPKGIGALYVRKKNPRVRLTPILHGGGQEQGFRSGTLNVAAIHGFGKACEIAKAEMKSDALRIKKLRDTFYQLLQKKLGDVQINGKASQKLEGNLNVSFEGVSSTDLLKELSSSVAVSTGSACATKNPEPSYVLKAIGIPETRIHSSLRFGFGRFTTSQEVQQAAQKVIQAVLNGRKKSPFYTLAKG